MRLRFRKQAMLRGIATARNAGCALVQHFNRTIDDFSFIPLNASEVSCRLTFRVENVEFDAMPVYERLDKINSKLEVFAKSVEPFLQIAADDVAARSECLDVGRSSIGVRADRSPDRKLFQRC